jgi:hypothetical protein
MGDREVCVWQVCVSFINFNFLPAHKVPSCLFNIKMTTKYLKYNLYIENQNTDMFTNKKNMFLT